MKKSLLLVALSVCLLPLWGQQNFSRIDSLIKKMLPEASEVGISVYDLTAKKSLYNYRAEKLSRPTSTMKLLTAITADRKSTRLNSSHRLESRMPSSA